RRAPPSLGRPARSIHLYVRPPNPGEPCLLLPHSFPCETAPSLVRRLCVVWPAVAVSTGAMLLSKLISGLGALSLARLGLAAAEEPLARRTDETEIADSSGQDEY